MLFRSWICPTSNLSEGTHNISAVAYDVAGNVLSISPPTYSLTIDTVVPNATITGSNTTTNVTAQTISGTGEVGSTVTVKDVGNVLGTTTVGANGTWTYNATGLTGGAGTSHTFTAIATDVAGNTSAVSSARVITIDTTAPDALVLSVNYLGTVTWSAAAGASRYGWKTSTASDFTYLAASVMSLDLTATSLAASTSPYSLSFVSEK